jgi:hypothetical protein
MFITKTAMSGAYKFRCLGRTSDGGRCRRRCRTEYSFCPIHESQRLAGAPLEVEHTAPVEPIEVFKDGDMTQRSCGHSCGLTLDKCCECIDLRAAAAVPAATRGDGYCTLCKHRYTERLPPPPMPDPLRRLIQFRNILVFHADEDDEEEQENLEFLREMIRVAQHRLNGR